MVRDILYPIPFHDAILSVITCDIEAKTVFLKLRNEGQDEIEHSYSILFKGVESCALGHVDIFAIEEISRVELNEREGKYELVIICLLGFGKPSSNIHILFEDLEVVQA